MWIFKSFGRILSKKAAGHIFQPVLESLQKMKEMGIWVEITTLLIPALNDSDEELKDIAGFIADLGKETPGISAVSIRNLKMLQDAGNARFLAASCPRNR